MEIVKEKAFKFDLRQIKLDRFVELDQLFRITMVGLLFAALLLVGDPLGKDFYLFVCHIAFLVTNSGIILVQNLRPSIRERQRIWSVWLDIFFFGLFNVFAGTAPSLFFNILFLWNAFIIGWRIGVRPGRWILALNLAVFVSTDVISILMSPTDNIVINSWPGIALSTIFILIIGSLLARVGDAERRIGEREKLIAKIRLFVKQGMGMNVFCNFILRELIDALEARQAQIVLFQSDGSYLRRRMNLKDGEPKVRVDELSEDDVQKHIKAKNVHLPLFFSKKGEVFEGYQLNGGAWESVFVDEQYRDLGRGLQRHTIIAVPLASSSTLFGRIVICASDNKQFTFDDVTFLRELLAVVVIFLDNIRLTEQIADEAAMTERRKIALDLHDRVIQPYVAVQIGIKGLRTKYQTDGELSEKDFERLVGISRDGVDDLREIVRQLKGADSAGQAFVPAVERFLKRFSEATAMAVDFKHDGIADGLYGSFSTDLFQMIAEGLSNVYRHSDSPVIRVSITGDGKRVVLTIEDEGRLFEDGEFFVPKSLSERASLRGGLVRVSQGTAGGVKVSIELPAPEILARKTK